MKKVLLFLSLVMSFSLFAGDHGMTKVTGTEIDLSMKGHSFAGKVGEKLIYGRIHGQAHKFADVTIDDSEKVLQVQFESTAEYFGGVILDGGNSTSIEFSRVINTTEEKAIVIKIDAVEYIVNINAEGFENNHFINPEFSTMIDGKKVRFKIHDGESCWMNSIQLVFSILGSYIH